MYAVKNESFVKLFNHQLKKKKKKNNKKKQTKKNNY